MILCCGCNLYHRVPLIFQSKSQLRILGVRMFMWSKFDTADPQFRRLVNLTGTLRFCTTHVDWYTFFVFQGKNSSNCAETARPAVQSLVWWDYLAPGIYSPPFEALCHRNRPITRAHVLLQFSSGIVKNCVFDGVPVLVSIRYSVFRVVSDIGVRTESCRKKSKGLLLCSQNYCTDLAYMSWFLR
jgi:hypothetical protein